MANPVGSATYFYHEKRDGSGYGKGDTALPGFAANKAMANTANIRRARFYAPKGTGARDVEDRASRDEKARERYARKHETVVPQAGEEDDASLYFDDQQTVME